MFFFTYILFIPIYPFYISINCEGIFFILVCVNINFSVMIYGYIRVSSDKQTVENQRFEINNFCERNKLVTDGWIEETISGTKSYSKRELGKLFETCKQG